MEDRRGDRGGTGRRGGARAQACVTGVRVSAEGLVGGSLPAPIRFADWRGIRESAILACPACDLNVTLAATPRSVRRRIDGRPRPPSYPCRGSRKQRPMGVSVCERRCVGAFAPERQPLCRELHHVASAVGVRKLAGQRCSDDVLTQSLGQHCETAGIVRGLAGGATGREPLSTCRERQQGNQECGGQQETAHGHPPRVNERSVNANCCTTDG
jgi:hypothetical protein